MKLVYLKIDFYDIINNRRKIYMIGIIIAIIVAILWSLGEVDYAKVAKKYNNINVYLYTFFLRSIIYLGVVFIFRRGMFLLLIVMF